MLNLITIAFICSAIYHLFCCYSHYVRDILVKVDYIGITIFITGSFMTWLYYAFHGETSQNCVYLYAICFGGLLVGILTQLDHFNARESRGHRAGIYVIFGLSLTIPAILLFQKSCKSRQTTKIISSVIYTTIIYMTGGFIYTTRLTERLWPGKVDIIGHSHQIFHVIVVIASIVHGYCSNDQQTDINSFDPEMNKEEIEERERLIQQVLELQNTLDDLSLRVGSVKEENLKLESENQVAVNI